MIREYYEVKCDEERNGVKERDGLRERAVQYMSAFEIPSILWFTSKFVEYKFIFASVKPSMILQRL